MKKLISVALVFVMFVTYASITYAGDMGVQIIGGQETETEPVSLDDIKLGVEVTIDGYGRLTPIAYTVQDTLGFYAQGRSEPSNDWWYRSGQEADYVILKMDIVNLAMRDKNFLENVEIKAIYNDKYEYGGWAYQFNYDNKISDWSPYGEYNKKQNMEFAIAEADIFPIGSMYQGHYCFGATLPNAVVNAKEPLRMIITIDGNEITYNIRK